MAQWIEMSLALLALSCSYCAVSSEHGLTGSCVGVSEVGETAWPGFPKSEDQTCQKPLEKDGWVLLLSECNSGLPAPAGLFSPFSYLCYCLRAALPHQGSMCHLLYLPLFQNMYLQSLSSEDKLLWYLLLFKGKYLVLSKLTFASKSPQKHEKYLLISIE